MLRATDTYFTIYQCWKEFATPAYTPQCRFRILALHESSDPVAYVDPRSVHAYPLSQNGSADGEILDLELKSKKERQSNIDDALDGITDDDEDDSTDGAYGVDECGPDAGELASCAPCLFTSLKGRGPFSFFYVVVVPFYVFILFYLLFLCVKNLETQKQ